MRANHVLREHVHMAPAPRQRLSARIAAVSESATLAVDAKAKALGLRART